MSNPNKIENSNSGEFRLDVDMLLLFKDLLYVLKTLTGVNRVFVGFPEGKNLHLVSSADTKVITVPLECSYGQFILKADKEIIDPNLKIQLPFSGVKLAAIFGKANSYAGFPLKDERNKSIAIISFYHSKKISLSPDQIQSIQILSRQAIEKLDQKRLYDQKTFTDEDVELNGLKARLQANRELIFRQKHLMDFQTSQLEHSILMLRKKQEELGFIADGMPASIALVNRSYNYEFVNKQYEEWFGRNGEELIGKSIISVIGEETFARIKPLFKTCMTGEVINFENTIPGPEGEKRHVNVTFVPAKDVYDKIKGVYVFLEDVSVLKNTQMALEESNMELQNFTRMASHDMKAPLRIMKSFSDLLSNRFYDKLDKHGKEYLDYIKEGAQDLTNLIDNLLDYALAGKQEDESIIPLPMDYLIEKVMINLKMQVEESGAEVIFPNELPFLKISDFDGIMIFQNLISNGLKYQKAGNKPILEIRFVETDAEVKICIEDNGIGIPQDRLEDVFKPFLRLHSKRAYEGSGIGLATCKKIMAKYEGDISISSVIGKGSTFCLVFPK